MNHQRRGPLALLLAVLTLQSIALLWASRHLNFAGDEIQFVAAPALPDGFGAIRELMQPYGEHWSFVPKTLTWAMVSMFGVESHWPFNAVLLVMHAVVGVLIFALLRQQRVGAWPASLAAVATSLFAAGAGAENVVFAFQTGFIGSVMFGLLAGWLAERGGVWNTIGAVASLILSLMSSGMGLVMVAWAVALAAFSGRLRAALVLGAIPAMAYVAWFLWLGHAGQGELTPLLGVLMAAIGMANVWTAGLLSLRAPHVLVVIGALIQAAVVVLVWRLYKQRSPLFASAAAGFVATAFMYALLGLSRGKWGVGAVFAARYTYVALVLAAPIVAAVMVWAGRRLSSRFQMPAAVVSVVLIAAVSASSFLFVRNAVAGFSDELQVSFSAVRTFEAHDEKMIGRVGISVDPPAAVRWIHVAGSDVAHPPVRLSAQQLLDERSAIQTAIGSDGFDLPSASAVTLVGGDTETGVRLDRCTSQVVSAGTILRMATGASGAQFQVRVEDFPVRTRLVDGTRSSRWRFYDAAPTADTMESLTEPLESKTQYVVGASAPQVTLEIALAAGPVELCPATG